MQGWPEEQSVETKHVQVPNFPEQDTRTAARRGGRYFEGCFNVLQKTINTKIRINLNRNKTAAE